jgi:membrane protein implicated in regulation of membrane protease activity
MGFLTVSPINDDNRLIVDNFRSELSRQLLVVALALLVVVLAWNAWRVFQFRRAVGHRRDDLLGKMGLATAPEPWGRKILRVGSSI